MTDQTPPCAPLVMAIRRLDGLVNWERASRANMVVDLSGIQDLLARLGNPERRFRTVHVTGTKGKGSVCALIEAGLMNAGWSVGRYASPHLECLNERITFLGRHIEDTVLAGVLERTLDARIAACNQASPAKNATWFDVMTAAAFLAFAEARLEWVVAEVGLGGRLDSTNAVHSEVAVITNVGLEHTEILGDTIEKIATEKAGIIKWGSVVITSLPPDTGAGRIVYEAARRQEAKCVTSSMSPNASILDQNTGLARTVLEELGRRGVASRVRQATLGSADLPDLLAERTRLPGRLERFRLKRPNSNETVELVLDGAHVGFALAKVLRDLQADHALAGKPVVLLGLGADKDAESMIAPFIGAADHIVCTMANSGKPGMDAQHISDLAARAGLSTEVALSPLAGLERCLQRNPVSWVLVVGSLHLVGTVRGQVLAGGVRA